MKIRAGTWDEDIYQSVFSENEYMIENFAGATVVDIGAHVGCFSVLAHNGGARSVYAFEPNEDNFKLLNQNSQGTSITARKYAVRESSGSFCKSIQSHDMRNTGGCPVAASDTGVPTISLDDIINWVGQIDILKIDCEGSEYKALLPCEKIRKVKLIAGEYHRFDGFFWDDLSRFFHENGFTTLVKKRNNDLGNFWAFQ